MTDEQIVIDVAKRFIEIEYEIRSLRVLLLRNWTHDSDPEAFV